MSGNEISIPNSGSLSTQVFGFNPRDDFKEMTQSDLILRRVRLAQSSLDIVKDGKAELGAWVVNGTGETVFPPTGGNVIVIGWFKEWIEWNTDKASTDKILARSADPRSEVGKRLVHLAETRAKIMTKKGEAMKVTEYFNFIGCIPEFTGNYTEMFQLSFSRTGHKIGKQWLNKLASRKLTITNADGSTTKVDSPIFGCSWQIDSKPERNADNEEYLVPVIGNGDQLTPEHWEALAPLSNDFRTRRAAFMEAGSEAATVEAEVVPDPKARSEAMF